MTDPAAPRPTITFDWATFESASLAVVFAVAEAADTDPASVDPLYSAVDPDALDTFLAVIDGPNDPDRGVTFVYGGYRVVLDAGGLGYLYDPDVPPVPFHRDDADPTPLERPFAE